MSTLVSIPQQRPTKTSADELIAFEVALRDLVGIALLSLEALEGAVSIPQFRLLLVLHERGRSSSTQVAQALGLAGSSVTRLGDRLAAAGYVQRGDDPLNRSVVTLDVTDPGRKLVRQVNARRRRELNRVLDRLDPSTRAICADALRALHATLGDRYATVISGPMPL